MGKLQPISKVDGRNIGFAITADKMKRICLNTALMVELGVVDKKDLFLYWDADYRRIGISRECQDKNVTPFTFDNRGYTSAKEFLQYCQIDTSEKGVRFYYEGMEGDIYVFGQPGSRNVTLRQDKNGNLERV